jgi:very-short-patch-repair endonuclease/predicted transcriptional regulator
VNGSYRSQLGRSELRFLENVWGPAFQYHYDGLKTEYPFKDVKGGQRFADFVYVRHGIRLVIEVDGFTTHARNISPGEFDDHLTRQNELILSGWLLLRFSSGQVERNPQQCQMQVKQAIGHWWSLTEGGFTVEDLDKWKLRKQVVIRMAMKRNGTIKPGDLVNELNISSRTAATWLKQFAQEGTFSYAAEQQRVTTYILTGWE